MDKRLVAILVVCGVVALILILPKESLQKELPSAAVHSDSATASGGVAQKGKVGKARVEGKGERPLKCGSEKNWNHR